MIQDQHKFAVVRCKEGLTSNELANVGSRGLRAGDKLLNRFQILREGTKEEFDDLLFALDRMIKTQQDDGVIMCIQEDEGVSNLEELLDSGGIQLHDYADGWTPMHMQHISILSQRSSFYSTVAST